MNLPPLLRAYLALTRLAPAILTGMARRAHVRQGAAPARLGERLGLPSAARMPGRMVWISAASVGEVTSAAALAERLAGRGVTVLMTTTTATGAETVARLAPRALHQFAPVDSAAAVGAFLDHWRPDAALFIEAELWPRMTATLADRGVPMALLNARASRSRARFPTLWRWLVSQLALATAQTEDVAAELRALGVPGDRLLCPGNLKADIAPPGADPAALIALTEAIGPRPVWAAVSTHEGEEEIALAAHARLPGDALLILVPRHPARGDALAARIGGAGIPLAQRSTGALPGPDCRVYLADTLGETGLVYRAAGLALVGGSLLPGPGGHTPFEPAALSCAILSGPHVANFADAYGMLERDGAAQIVDGSEALAATLTRLLADTAEREAMQQAAGAVFARQSGSVAATVTAILPLLRRDNPGRSA